MYHKNVIETKEVMVTSSKEGENSMVLHKLKFRFERSEK
jgi:hypothetical protein